MTFRLLIETTLLIVCVILCVQSIELNGNFTYCNIHEEKAVVDMNARCDFKYEEEKIENHHIVVMSKRHFVLDASGFECYKKKIVRYE